MPDYREYTPPPALAGDIECFWSATRPDAAPRLILPDGCVDILFSTTAGLQVVGLMTEAQTSADPAGTRYLGLRFRPARAAAFVPEAAELTDRVVSLDEVWKPSIARRLADRLHGATPAVAIHAFLDELPAPRSVRSRASSDRHHRRLYRQASGVSPKFMQRILRFRRASEAIRRLPQAPNWAHFAAAHGYFDQAHFIREFQEFARATPGRYLQSLGAPALVA